MQTAIDNLDDATLIERVLAGDRESFSPLMMRAYPSVLRLCERLLGTTLEAQDIAQDAALEAFLRLSQLRDPMRFSAWFHAIAANLAHSALRRRRTVSLEALPGSVMLQLVARSGQTPEDMIAAREIHDTIVAALSELSSVNRDAVLGFYLNGYSYAELAELLGVPVSAVKGRLFKGRRRLRQTLEPLARSVLKPDRRQQKELSMPMDTLVQVHIDSIYAESWGHRLALLRPPGEQRVLPIRVGPVGAEAISAALMNDSFVRPLTHDLMVQHLTLGDIQVREVVLHQLAPETYAAAIVLERDGEEHIQHSRPSDALPLALRAGAPIYVSRAALESDCIDVPKTLTEGLATWRPSSYSLSTMLDLALNDPDVRPIEWEGAEYLAVRIPGFESVDGLRERVQHFDKAAWLVVEPGFWEWVVEFATMRRVWSLQNRENE